MAIEQLFGGKFAKILCLFYIMVSLISKCDYPKVVSYHQAARWLGCLIDTLGAVNVARRRRVQVDEIPTDSDVMAVLGSNENGLRPSEIVKTLEAQGHTYESIVSAMQRVLDRGKVSLRDGGRFVPVAIPQAA